MTDTDTATAVDSTLCPFDPVPGCGIALAVERQKSKGGIHLVPKTWEQQPQQPQPEFDAIGTDYRVVKLGAPGKSIHDGSPVAFPCQPGDRIRLARIITWQEHHSTGSTRWFFFDPSDVVATVTPED